MTKNLASKVHGRNVRKEVWGGGFLKSKTLTDTTSKFD